MTTTATDGHDMALTTQKGNALAAQHELGDMGGLTQQDLQIPQIQLIQKKSKVEEAELAKAGAIFETMENTTVGDDKNPVEFIPLSMSKSWRIYDISKGKDKREYKQTVPFGPENADWKFEATGANNEPILRQLVASWNILLVKQCEGGDPFPFRLNFKGASFQASKKLATLVAKGSFLNVPMCGKVYKLMVQKQSKNNNTFFAFDVGPSRPATEDEKNFAKLWIGIMNTKRVEEAVPAEAGDAYEG